MNSIVDTFSTENGTELGTFSTESLVRIVFISHL